MNKINTSVRYSKVPSEYLLAPLLMLIILFVSVFYIIENNYNDILIIIPIIITFIFLVPRLSLIIVGKRPPFDVWSIFTYTALLVFIYSPLYHLITGRPIAKNLPYDMTELISYIAWTCVPIIPLFYLGSLLVKKKSYYIKHSYEREPIDKFINIGIFYILIGMCANIAIMVAGGIPLIAGTLFVLKDFFSVGLLLVYYGVIKKLTKKGIKDKKKHQVLCFISLIIIIFLISYFNLERGSRFFILIYAFWGLHIYSTHVAKINMSKIIIITVLLIPLLTQYKLYKYTGYDSQYVLDSNYRSQIQEQYSQLTPTYTLATDLGRYYIWMLYYQEVQPGGNIDYQYGKTYLDAILTMFPKWIVKNKPPGMIELSHDAESGRGYYKTYHPSTAKIGGFWAESYVNFGIMGVWIMAIVGGYILGVLDKIIRTRSLGYITPVLGGLIATFGSELLLQDSRLILWHLSKYVVTVIPLIILLKLKTRRKGEAI